MKTAFCSARHQIRREDAYGAGILAIVRDTAVIKLGAAARGDTEGVLRRPIGSSDVELRSNRLPAFWGIPILEDI